MQGYEIPHNSSSWPLVFLLISEVDHITGLTGASPVVQISKCGTAFAAPDGAISEIGNGWYQVAGNAGDTSLLGPLVLHATANGADPTDWLYPIVTVDAYSTTSFGLVTTAGYAGRPGSSDPGIGGRR